MSCPPISHLLFVDDSLFFFKRQIEEYQTIPKILKDYEVVSAQQINFQKSTLQFRHKIEKTTKQESRDILGIQTIGGMGSYLTIPENLGGPKTQIFCFIRERLNNRVNGWTIFYERRKKVLIKLVVTALPNHVMPCCQIPKAVAKN